MKKYIQYLWILALGMVACEPEFENPVDDPDAYSSGEANFSNYVALGNSMTAGYADNALYRSGQLNSFPNILAQQFAKVGGGEFTQPLMADNVGGLLYNGNQIAGTRLVLAFNAEGQAMPGNYAAEPTTDIADILTGPFNNMGVPGAKSYHLLAPGYGDIAGVEAGTSNQYFVRFASSPETTVLADALAQEPTFFTLWIGNNDILNYASSGGTGMDQTGNTDLSSYAPNDITDPGLFAGIYSQLVTSLTETGAEGVLLNIPNITDIPFFTRVPYNPLSPTNPDFGPMIPALNASFAQLNPALLALRGIDESEGGDTPISIEFRSDAASSLLIRDESLPDISQQLTEVLMQNGMDQATATIYGSQYGQVRQATPMDLLVLTSSGAIGQVNQERVAQLMQMGVPQETAVQLSINGVTFPMADQYVLTPDEQEMINTARLAYNQIIEQIATANDLGFVDAASALDEIRQGIPFDGGVINADYVTGGVFSLDGVHLTPRGYAFVANRIIDEINETYDASVPKVNIGAYGTITPNNNIE